MLRYNPRYQIFLALSDAVIVAVALALAAWLRLTLDLGAPGVTDAFVTPPALFPIAIFLWLFAFQQAKVYSAVDSIHFRPAARRVIAGHVVACLLFLGVLYITYRDYSRLQALYFMALALIGVLGHRFVLRVLRGRLSPYINNQRVVIIAGANAVGARLGAKIDQADHSILRLAGYVRLPVDAPADEAVDAARLLGEVDQLAEVVRGQHADEVIIAVRWFDETVSELVSRIMLLLESQPVSIRLAPDYSDLAYFHATSEYFDDMMLVGLREPVLSPLERALKRLFDIAFSGAVLLITWPLLLIIALAIRRDSPGPAIFRQERIGQHGRRFMIYKFRTMYLNADDIVRREDAGQFVKRPDDPRVTPVGRFLRRTSLDELPQFINVLRGDMSIVGPRPEVLWLADQYEWWQRKRFEVPQGITGWWQITGRADKPMRLNTEDDLYYVRNYSFWLDLQIVLRTICSVITGRGAY